MVTLLGLGPQQSHGPNLDRALCFLSFCVGIVWFAEIVLSSQQEQRCAVAVLHEVIQNGFGAPVKKQRYHFNTLLLILLFSVKPFLF